MTLLIAIIGAIASLASALSVGMLIKFFVERHDAKHDATARLEKKLNTLEKDSVRTQLLVLMMHYDDGNEGEILEVAQHYFKDLGGNWYMTTLFYKFVTKKKIACPEWLDISKQQS